MASPLFKINDGPVGEHYEADYDEAITVEVYDRTDVHSVQWEFIGRNRSTVVYPTIAPQGQGYVATFTLPSQVDGYGIGLGLRCTVNGGVIPGTNTVDPDLTTTSGIYVAATGGLHPPFIGETYEYDLEFGWGERIIKNQTDSSVGGDLTGTLGYAVIAKLAGVPFSETISLPSDGMVLTYDSVSGKIVWNDALKTFSDGSDGNLTISSSNVALGVDKQYHTISFVSGHTGKLLANGWPIRCRVLDLRNANAGAVNCDGIDGAESGSPPAGFNGPLPPCGKGGPAGEYGYDADLDLAARTEAMVFTGLGGRGGSASTISSAQRGAYTNRFLIPTVAPNIVVGLGGTGSGACQGGSSGGYLYIRADTIITDGTTAAGAISAKGGKGAKNTGINTAGSGGGAGGVIDLECNIRSGSAVTDLLNASGGDGGGASGGHMGGGGGCGGLIRAWNRGKVTYVSGDPGPVAPALNTAGVGVSTKATF